LMGSLAGGRYLPISVIPVKMLAIVKQFFRLSFSTAALSF
jgi:hypothetical protein